jgi:hypothetical protein
MDAAQLNVYADVNAYDAYANADILSPSGSLSLYNASVVETAADAAGSYSATVDTTGQGGGQALSVGGLDIKVTYSATSPAATGPAGGVSASVVNSSMNKATAQTRLSAAAGLLGSGRLEVSGNANVQVIGRAKAVTEGRTYNLGISGVKIAVNWTSATLNVTQSANVKNTGTMTIGGTLKIQFAICQGRRLRRRDGHHRRRGRAAACRSWRHHNVARAIVAVEIYAGITNDALAVPGLITAGAVDIDALASTLSTAAAKTGYGVSVVTIGNLDAVAISYSTVKAYIQNALVETANSTSVNATSLARANASSEAPGGIGIASGTSAKARAFVGMPAPGNLSDDDRSGLDGLLGQKPQPVSAYASAASVTAGGISRSGPTTRGMRYPSGEGHDGLRRSISRSSIPTFSEYYTHAQVLGGSALVAAGSISITAEDLTRRTPWRKASPSPHRKQRNHVRPELPGRRHPGGHRRVLLKAREALNVLATSRAVMDAQTVADGGGAWTAAACMCTTPSTATPGSAFWTGALSRGLRKPRHPGDFRHPGLHHHASHPFLRRRGCAGQDPRLHDGVERCHRQRCERRADCRYLQYRADHRRRVHEQAVDRTARDRRGLGRRAQRPVQYERHDQAAGGHRGLRGQRAGITGRYVEFRGITSKLYIYDYCYASGKALGANVVAHVHQNTDIDVVVKVSFAVIRAYDGLTMITSSAPTGDSRNVYAHSSTSLKAIGESNSNVSMTYDNSTRRRSTPAWTCTARTCTFRPCRPTPTRATTAASPALSSSTAAQPVAEILGRKLHQLRRELPPGRRRGRHRD